MILLNVRCPLTVSGKMWYILEHSDGVETVSSRPRLFSRDRDIFLETEPRPRHRGPETEPRPRQGVPRRAETVRSRPSRDRDPLTNFQKSTALFHCGIVELKTRLLAPFDEVEEEKLLVYNNIQYTNDQVTEHSSTHSIFFKCPTFEDEQKNTNLYSRRYFANFA